MPNKKERKKAVGEIRPVERTLENVLKGQKVTIPEYMARLTPQEATIAQGYGLALRSALADDGHPPLCAAGLRLAGQLSSIAASFWCALRRDINSGQETRHKQRRFRQHPEDYLQALEAQYEQLMQPKDAENPGPDRCLPMERRPLLVRTRRKVGKA